jgi:hypothetical protein
VKKRIFYSSAIFLAALVGYSSFGFSEILLGILKWSDAKLIISLSLIISTIASVIFFFSLKAAGLGNKPIDKNYKPTRKFIIFTSILTVISFSFGLVQAHSDYVEKEPAIKKAEEIQKKKASLADAERERESALTPEQRAAEAKINADRAQAASDAEKKIAQEQETKKKLESDAKAKRNLQMTIAAMGAQDLKNSMKDPDSFELKSLLFMPDGAACYEYRATNSFGAHLKGEAVYTPKGKLLVHEQNPNAFISAWNKECTVSSGEEIAFVVNQIGLK